MTIDRAAICPKCRLDHEAAENAQGKTLEIKASDLCADCKRALGIQGRAKRGTKMKRGRKAGKAPRLSKETRAFIKGVIRSGKKAVKLQAKADKLQARVDEMRERAARERADIEALKKAVKDQL